MSERNQFLLKQYDVKSNLSFESVLYVGKNVCYNIYIFINKCEYFQFSINICQYQLNLGKKLTDGIKTVSGHGI